MAQIEQVYRDLGVLCTGLDKPITEDQLMAEVLLGQPVQIGFTYSNATVGHVVLVIDSKKRRKTGMMMLQVADPREKDGKQTLHFDDVKTDSQRGTWVWTWLYMKRREP